MILPTYVVKIAVIIRLRLIKLNIHTKSYILTEETLLYHAPHKYRNPSRCMYTCMTITYF